MLEEVLIRHSAPTLAGLKTANLFGIHGSQKRNLKIAQSFGKEF